MNKATGTKCALKIVNKGKLKTSETIQALMEQELDILQKTEHPNIVRVIELLEGPVNFYVVMELVTGGDLCGYILKQKKFSERRTAIIVKQILLAINYMH